MGGGNGREESGLRARAEAAEAEAARTRAAAAVPDPIESDRRKRAMALQAWRSGEAGPIDVRNMPGGAVPMGLFNDAKQARDEGRIGRGYGMLNDGANPNFAAALGKEMDLERSLAASGALENNVDQTLGALDEELGDLTGIGNSRSQYLAQLARAAAGDANDRLSQFRQNKKPSFLKQLALGAIGNVSGTVKGLSI